MRTLLLLVGMLAAAPAGAQECNIFTHEARPPGEVVAEMIDHWHVEIRNEYAEPVLYRLTGAGTGMPYMVGTAISPAAGLDSPVAIEGERPITLRRIEGKLIIDMMVYEPYCDTAAEKAAPSPEFTMTPHGDGVDIRMGGDADLPDPAPPMLNRVPVPRPAPLAWDGR